MRSWRDVGLGLMAAVAALLLPPTAALACPGQTQLDMNACAEADYKRADADLNAYWRPVKAHYDAIGAGDVLLDAQRKWLAFRDAACAAETAPYAGGSILPLVHWTCLARLTWARADDLRALMPN